MRKPLLLALTVIVLGSFTYCQTVEEMKKCVAFLFGQVHAPAPVGSILRDQTGRPVLLEMPLGTAFFVSYPDKRGGEDYSFFYLVTAKHVLKDADGGFLKSITIRLNMVKSENGSSVGSAEVPVTDPSGKLLWFEDKDDPQNDVVLTPLLPDQQKASFKAVPVQMFADANLLTTQHVTEGDSVYLFGLMPQYYGEKRNYPVVRKGSLALITDEEIKTGPDLRQHVYLAELGSWPGNSGAPVFLNFSGLRGSEFIGSSRFFLLGLMLGYFSNLREADLIETRTVLGGDPSNIGISYILPASTIRKVLESVDAQHARDEEINHLKSH
jgi:hypothetical protein